MQNVWGRANNNDGWAIKLVLSHDSKVQGNTVDNNPDNIELFGGTDDRITANKTNNNNASGIFLFYRSSGNTVSDNTADNNKSGIALQTGSTGNTIKANTALVTRPPTCPTVTPAARTCGGAATS